MGIEEAFANLAQATEEDRAAVTNLPDSNRHLATQVNDQANHMATKYNAMETMTKLIQKIHGQINIERTQSRIL